MQVADSPHGYNGAIGAAWVGGGMSTGTAEWRVRVELGPRGSDNVMVGVARAGVALSAACPRSLSKGEAFFMDNCDHYSAFSCTGYLYNALDYPTKPWKGYPPGMPTCKSGDVVTVHLDVAKGTLAYSLNGVLFKNLTAGVKANLPLALVASTSYNGASVDVVGYARAP